MNRLCICTRGAVGVALLASVGITLTLGVNTFANEEGSLPNVPEPQIGAGQIDPLIAAIPRPPGNKGTYGGDTGGISGEVVFYSTGFEAPDFAVGPIDGQGPVGLEWRQFAASAVEGHVDDANPNMGTQHLRVSKDPDVADATNVGAFSPDLGDFNEINAVVSVWVHLKTLDVNGADYQIAPQAPSQGFVTARMVFVAGGAIEVLDDVGNGLEFVDTGMTWAPGSYKLVTITLDNTSNSLDYTYDIQSYSGVAGVIAGTSVEEVVLFGNNSQVPFDFGADFDDLSIAYPDGACCDADGQGNCLVVTEPGCIASETGLYLGDNTDCSFCLFDGAPCGLPNAGACDEPNGSPGCELRDCCLQVCAILNDEFCCEVDWDQDCVDQAIDVCTFPYECNADPESPANDCCAVTGLDPQEGPTVVMDGDVVAFDTTLARTDGVNDPSNPCSSANNDSNIWKDVWYVFDATANGLLTTSVCTTTDFDTKIAAYDVPGGTVSEEICNQLIDLIVDCNEDCEPSAPYRSELQISVIAGQTYLLRLGGYSGSPDGGSEETAEFGSGTISFELAEVPAGADLCDNAVSAFDGENLFSSVDAATDGPAHAACDEGPGDDQVHRDIWFNYTATATGGLRIDTCANAGFDTRVAIYDTNDCNELSDVTLLGCDDDGAQCPGFTSNLIVSVVQGNEYIIRMGGFDEDSAGIGTMTLTPQCTVEVPPDAVDEGEPCGDDTNGGCNAQGAPEDFVNVNSGDVVTGEGFADAGSRDTDWYLISQDDIVAADVDQDGLAKLCYSVQSQIPMGAGIVPVLDSQFPECTSEFVFSLTSSEGCEVGPIADYGDGLPDNPVEAVPGNKYALLVLAYESGVGGIFGDYPCAGPLGNTYIACVQAIDDDDECPTEAECFGAVDTCPWDLTDDGFVGINDLLILLANWGPNPGHPADFNGDDFVGINDLLALLANWGTCPQ
ncbi:MAG: hypothetical protein ACYS0G_08395 [Planctomycetota bacterium]|jgi:hypothetical protein